MAVHVTQASGFLRNVICAISLLILGCRALEETTYEQIDAEWEQYLSTHTNHNNKVAEQTYEERGKDVGCIVCNLIVEGTELAHHENMQKPVGERMSESDIFEVLLVLCRGSANDIAEKYGHYVYPKNVDMVCRQIARRHYQEMIDTLAMGEDIFEYCHENKLCSYTRKDQIEMQIRKHNADVRKRRGEDTRKDIEEIEALMEKSFKKKRLPKKYRSFIRDDI
mmetsp:Transcript_64353/g.112282  ORF Transcript_64353/g.112282 Transcript_64353/m.112282 type:complete len:223 (+) Transcript_64353:61-729(+)